MSTMRTLFSIIIFSSIFAVNAIAANPTKQIDKLFVAIQRNDFKTIFDNSYYYQAELSQMRSANPKALWPKLSAEYYEAKKSNLYKQQGVWQNYDEALTGFFIGGISDPKQNILTLRKTLVPTSTWKVLETKKSKLGKIDVFLLYCSLNFKDVQASPVISTKVLKQGLLEIVLDSKSGLYIGSSRVAKGDVYWGGEPSLDVKVANKLLMHGLYDESINILDTLYSKGTLNDEGRKVLASAYFERVRNKSFLQDRGTYYRFNEDAFNKGRKDVDRAIALDQSVREKWIDLLCSLMQVNLKSNFARSSGEKNVNDIAIVATEYARGYPELQKKVYPLALALARIYISWAANDVKRGSYYFILKYTDYAMTLLQDDLTMRYEVLSKAINPFLANIMKREEEEQRAWPQATILRKQLTGKPSETEEILMYIDKWKFSLGPDDRPLFSKAANHIASKYIDMVENYPRQKKYQESALYWTQKAKEWKLQPSDSLEPTEKITLASLTRDIPDDEYFIESSVTNDSSVIIVWPAVNKYFAGHKKIKSDPDKRYLITERNSGVGQVQKYISVVHIEEISENSCKIAIKTFCYKHITDEWVKMSPDDCSKKNMEGIIKEITRIKEISK